MQKRKLFGLSACVYKKQKRILILMSAVLYLFTHSLFNDCNKSELHSVKWLKNNIFERMRKDMVVT